MFELDNRSDWAAGLYPGWSRDGKRQITAVLKIAYSYDLQGRVMPLTPPPELEEADRYHGEPGRSSLAAACETVPFKDGGELLLGGTAHPSKPGSTVMEVSVGLRRVNDRFWEKTLRLFGPRRWDKSLLGISASKPAPLEPLPLRYEHAYGGVDPNHENQCYGANPVGSGFSQKGWRVKGMALPQIEIGPKFISGPSQRVAPAGFGPIAPYWEPRLNASKELDGDAVSWGGCPFGNRAPAGLYNAAPLDQRFDAPFEGGETIRLKGLISEAPHPDGTLVHLPCPRPDLKLVSGNRVENLQAVCDTLTIDIDARTICMLWRTGLPWNMQDQHSEWVVLRDLDLEEERLHAAEAEVQS